MRIASLFKKIPGLQKIVRLYREKRRLKLTRQFIASLAKSNKQIKLDLGGGNLHGTNGWLTIDLTDKCDLFHDLRHGLPFSENSVDAIYSSHLLEHLSYEETQNLLIECLRVLKKNGTISLCVPDASIYIKSYIERKKLDPAIFYTLPGAWRDCGHLDAVNYIAYMAGHHRYMFDNENLCEVMIRAGFKNVAIRNFDESLDNADRAYESIYAKGEKP